MTREDPRRKLRRGCSRGIKAEPGLILRQAAFISAFSDSFVPASSARTLILFSCQTQMVQNCILDNVPVNRESL